MPVMPEPITREEIKALTDHITKNSSKLSLRATAAKAYLSGINHGLQGIGYYEVVDNLNHINS